MNILSDTVATPGSFIMPDITDTYSTPSADGTGTCNRVWFPNGFGVSIVRHSGAYAGDGTWEVAVIVGSEARWDFYFDGAAQVEGWASDARVGQVLMEVSRFTGRAWGVCDPVRQALVAVADSGWPARI